ncbi:helicase HerA-like domain-containing protein [Curtobacterium sp. Leaf261]|uniref:helicase HerA-like domain-containing protein n=1 Tax=Curtobacterium sp. Leaf261 TaxID=1736311 RepID=UPI0006F5972B|nr:helicase HerA-like domain-containing protein [Curtobacterium sp. Leaf261]KQO62272.1 ATPase [Curtobacterium sp. Leaf261]
MSDPVEEARAAAAAARTAADEARRLADEAAARAEVLADALEAQAVATQAAAAPPAPDTASPVGREAPPAPATEPAVAETVTSGEPAAGREAPPAPATEPAVAEDSAPTGPAEATTSVPTADTGTGTVPPDRPAEGATDGNPADGAGPTPAAPTPTAPTPAGPTPAGPLSATGVDAVRTGYAVEGTAVEVGALVNGEALPDVQVRIPLGMLNRHGLVAGATGTGKTKTLQVLAEQIAAAGVPVFAADVKGDLSGLAVAGSANPKLLARTEGIGQDWTPAASTTEFFSLGGTGTGVPVRATVSGFGPLLMAKVLGLNDTQESSLGLVFHYAEQAGLPLVDLTDLRSVLTYLTSDAGKGELADLGGLSKQTVGVILRELITFADQGADTFFGVPEIDTQAFLRTAADGTGIVSLLEVPGVQDKPAVFSTFLMWMLADLFNELPEVGDQDKPKLVFFFDEAHLLFSGASKDFLEQITRTVRLIRSKGVGVFFVTQTPKDVPNDVLAQLGSRIQHQLRAHTPDDAKALRATVSTYPTSEYDLGEVLTSLATGEAIVTVMNEKGAPTPVAWTRLRAPRGSMDPMPAAAMSAAVEASPLFATYGTPVDPDSAHEILARKLEAAAASANAAAAEEEAAARQADAEVAAAKQAKEAAAAAARDAKTEERERAAAQREYERTQREFEKAERAAEAKRSRTTSTRTTRTTRSSRGGGDALSDMLGGGLGGTIAKEVVKGIFSTLRRR